MDSNIWAIFKHLMPNMYGYLQFLLPCWWLNQFMKSSFLLNSVIFPEGSFRRNSFWCRSCFFESIHFYTGSMKPLKYILLFILQSFFGRWKGAFSYFEWNRTWNMGWNVEWMKEIKFFGKTLHFILRHTTIGYIHSF